MKRTLTLIPAAALVFALLMPVSDAGAEPVSTYKTKSYRDGGVVLRMNVDKGSILSPGEEISFSYQTGEDALVILFNIDTEGYVHLLHPFDGSPSTARARQTYRVPEGSDRLLVSGETGMEFVFALTIPDASALDAVELAYLREVENRPLEDRYRIDGDPFLAANIIAGELVRGISHRDGVFLDYTYFYVNQRVDHPCYLCGECGGAEAALCDDYQLVADFDRASPMTYPLARAYTVVERGVPAAGDDVDVAYRTETVDDGEDVNVSFYPYSVEVRYVTQPRAYYYYDPYWYDPFWYDPWYCGYVYYPGYRYPYYGHYYSWSFNWGYWGGYYCSGWYYPRYRHWSDYYHHNYWDYAHGYGGVKYKSAYKERSSERYKTSNTLVAARNTSVKRGSALKIRSADLKRTDSKTRVARTGAKVRSGKSVSTTRSAIGRTTVKTRSGRSITNTRPVTRSGKAPTIRSTTRSRTSKPAIRSRSGSTTRKGSEVKRGGSRTTSKPRVKSRSSSSSRTRSKGTVKKSSGSRSSSKSSSVKRSSSSRSSSKSTSRSSSSRSSSSKKGSRGKRK